jgi:hypothetical protein
MGPDKAATGQQGVDRRLRERSPGTSYLETGQRKPRGSRAGQTGLNRAETWGLISRRRPSSRLDRGGLPGWKTNTWRKQAAGLSLLPPEIRTRTKDDEDDRKGSLGRPDQRGRASDERLQLTK